MFTYVFGMIIMVSFGVAIIAIAIHDLIRDYKENEQKEREDNRRKQLIKEMKAGTFDEKKMEQMIKELGTLMHGHFWSHYKCVMTKKETGIWQLTTLETDGYSRI